MYKGFFVVLLVILSLAGGTLTVAEDILGAAGVKGGFVVYVGCETPKQLSSIGAKNGFVVQGLSGDTEIIATARKQIKSAGLYGKVSVAFFDGKELPYVDSFVNLLVISDAGGLCADEIERVLVPGGRALIK